MASNEILLAKMENLEQVLAGIRNFLSTAEDNPINGETKKQDLERMVKSLRMENVALKNDVDQLHMALTDLKVSKDYLSEKLEALEQELLESQNLSDEKGNPILIQQVVKQHEEPSEDSLQQEVKTLKVEIENAKETAVKAELAKQGLNTSVETLQRENKTLKSEKDELRSNLAARDDLLKKLEHLLDIRRQCHETEVRTLKLNNAAICKKLESSKQELEVLKAKHRDIEQHFSAEKVKNLIARVNISMNNCDVDSAISIFTSYIFKANLISNFNIVHVFNKIYRIKEILKSFEEQLSLESKNCNLITTTYNQLNSIVDYPNLILQVEKKLLGYYHKQKYYLTAISLCDRLIIIRKSKDPWVYLVRGELFLHKGNYRDAREAFIYSLKFSKEGDPGLDAVYEQARKALEQEISANVWSLFITDGSTFPLPQKELYSKYKELIRYYHPDKQHGYVKQYKDIAECMSKELTQSYRLLTT